jgi:hypothetical protein
MSGRGGGRDEGYRFVEVLWESRPDLQIAHRLLKICLRIGSNQHDEGKARVG